MTAECLVLLLVEELAVLWVADSAERRANKKVVVMVARWVEWMGVMMVTHSVAKWVAN